MSTKKCKHCQSEIDEKATKCPHCQSDLRNWFQKHPILTVILVFVLIGMYSASITPTKKEIEINKPLQSPVAYKIGYTSGALATISVPQETTNTQLKELLNYFHLLKNKGELSNVMSGHTVIDIFDDEKWTTKESYNNFDPAKSNEYCNYIKATYSIDLHGVERAGIGMGDCPNYEEVIKPITPTDSKYDLKVSVKFTGTQFVISNLDDSDCVDAKLEINGGVFKGGYILEGYTLKAGNKYEVGALQFAKSNGERFNPYDTKPMNFFIDCRNGASWLGNLN